MDSSARAGRARERSRALPAALRHVRVARTRPHAVAGNENAINPHTPIDMTDLNLTIRSMFKNRSGRPRCLMSTIGHVDASTNEIACAARERFVVARLVRQRDEDAGAAHHAAHEQVRDDFPFPVRLFEERAAVVRRRRVRRERRTPSPAPRYDASGSSAALIARGTARIRRARALPPRTRRSCNRPADASTGKTGRAGKLYASGGAVKRKNALRSPTDDSESTP